VCVGFVVIALAVAGLTVVAATVSVPVAQADTAPVAPTPATVSADALPTMQINGIVWAQVTIGDIVYTISQADVDNGASISNVATSTATAPDGPDGPSRPITSPPSSPTTHTGVDAVSSFTLRKSGAISGRGRAGDALTWSIVITNTGTSTLTDLSVLDPTAGPVTCPSTTVAPATSETCTVPAHTITAAEAISGAFTNSASASGSGTNGNDGTKPTRATSTQSTTVSVVATPTPLALTGVAMLVQSLWSAAAMLIVGIALLLLAGRRRRRLG
jgi:uncharacterized repeat protein (TIGR01451 family)